MTCGSLSRLSGRAAAQKPRVHTGADVRGFERLGDVVGDSGREPGGGILGLLVGGQQYDGHLAQAARAKSTASSAGL